MAHNKLDAFEFLYRKRKSLREILFTAGHPPLLRKEITQVPLPSLHPSTPSLPVLSFCRSPHSAFNLCQNRYMGLTCINSLNPQENPKRYCYCFYPFFTDRKTEAEKGLNHTLIKIRGCIPTSQSDFNLASSYFNFLVSRMK